MNTRSLLAFLVVITAFLHTGQPHARSARSACLDRQLAGAMAQGWRTRGVDTDSVLPGDSAAYEMSFYKGSRYLFLACTDDSDASIVITAMDAQGRPVGLPSDKGVSTLLELKAAHAGSHTIQVTATSPTEGRPVWVSLAMLYR